MPAAAVIPAPVAYIKVVAVKKLVVGFLACCAWPAGVSRCVPERGCHPSGHRVYPSLGGRAPPILYFEKIRVFKAGLRRCEYISME